MIFFKVIAKKNGPEFIVWFVNVWLNAHRIATKANKSPMAAITNEPTVPPTVTVILFDEDDLVRFEDTKKIKKNTFNIKTMMSTCK